MCFCLFSFSIGWVTVRCRRETSNYPIQSRIAKTLGSTSIKHRTDTFASFRYFIDIDLIGLWYLGFWLRAVTLCGVTRATLGKHYIIRINRTYILHYRWTANVVSYHHCCFAMTVFQLNVWTGPTRCSRRYATPVTSWWQYSISQEICTRFCFALLCCGYAIIHNEFTWSIYPYSSGLLCWHWGNR